MREHVAAGSIDVERVRLEPVAGSNPDTFPATVAARRRETHQTTTRIVLAILCIALVKQLVLVVSYPAFEGHDEVAHYGYVATLDRERRLPTLADNLPPETGPYSRFTLDWPAVYTANHPPLYYLLAWPLYRLAPPDVEARLYAMRLFSVPLFMLVVWLTYLLTLRLFRGERFLVVTAPALIAFQPQLSFEGAIVNNDILAMLVGAVILVLLADMLRRGWTTERALLLGTVLGVGLLTKATLTALVPIAVGVAVWCAWRDSFAATSRPASWKQAAVNVAALGTPALAVSLPWFVFLYAAYGDVTVFRSLDLLQATWGAPSTNVLELLVSPGFHHERLHEGWGYFGWRLLPLGRVELWLVTIATALAAVGLAVEGQRAWLRRQVVPDNSARIAVVAMLVASCAVFFLAMVYFGTRVSFTQARYVFPVAPAAALLAALGFRALIAERWRSAGAAVLVSCAMLFQMLLLTRLVLPHALP